MKRIVLSGVLLLAGLAYGDADALYKQGVTLLESNPGKAHKLFEQAAEAGNVSAMVGAGHCLETGTGTTVNYAEAIEWYEKAVQQNSLKACEGLARIYASCESVRFHDGKKAVKYAAALSRRNPSDSDVLMLLARAYLRNMQVDKAVKAGTKALRNADSIDEVNKLKAEMTAYPLGQPVPALATIEWVEEAAGRNVRWAMLKAAQMYGNRASRLYSPPAALEMCQKSIDAGDTQAHALMGDVYYEADAPYLSLEKARACYDAAVKAGCYKGATLPLQVRHRSYLTLSADHCFKEAGKYENGYERTEQYISHYDDYSYSLPNGSTHTVERPVYQTRTVKVRPDPVMAEFLYTLAAKKKNSAAAEWLKRKNKR